jgi:hypothetical protein
MTTENYLIIENNIVTNVVVWDGDINTWIPPTDSIQLIQSTISALIWVLNTNRTEYVLTEQLGIGQIGFTWNGLILTTNLPQPPAPKPSETKIV